MYRPTVDQRFEIGFLEAVMIFNRGMTIPAVEKASGYSREMSILSLCFGLEAAWDVSENLRWTERSQPS